MRRARHAALAIAIWLAVAPVALPSGAAVASDVTRGQAMELAARAAEDPAALAQLEAVTAIDGRPADVGATLAGASPAELERRLDALERSLTAPQRGDADAAANRAEAESIVAGFPEEEPEPYPSDGSSASEGEGIGLDIGGLWLPLAILAVVAGTLIALRLARNREAAGRLAAGEEEAEDEPLDELALRAGRAEQAGEYGEALRLRYGIALRALQAAGAVPAGPSVTPARVSRELADPRAEGLVGTFERVVYGGRRAAPDDAREAREGWAAVVARTPAGGDDRP